MYDISADVLPPGQSQMGLFFANYTRGILPRFSLSSHLAGDALGVLNLEAKMAVLKREELRLSAELGAIWPASLQLAAHWLLPELSFAMVKLPMGVRASTPLASNLELHLAGLGDLSYLQLAESSQWSFGLRSELTLALYDHKGAFLLRARFPLLTHSLSTLDLFGAQLSGTLVLDDLASWGILLARDHIFSETIHLRLGLGYRHRPGTILLDSIGRVLVELDVFWR